MDFHESIDQCRERIGKAKAAYCLCNYDEALALLCTAYSNVRSLIEQVYKTSIEAARAERPAVENPGGP